MKIMVTVNNYAPSMPSKPQGWFLIADSALTNTGKPFYIPDFGKEVVVSLSAALRISRLGKCVSEKFAPRYFEECCAALHFSCPELGNDLLNEGLPADPARSFDKCLFVGDAIPYGEMKELSLLQNGEHVSGFSFDHLILPVTKIIEMVSEMNTIKMGDLILPAVTMPARVNEGDLLEVMQNGRKAFEVRVK